MKLHFRNGDFWVCRLPLFCAPFRILYLVHVLSLLSVRMHDSKPGQCTMPIVVLSSYSYILHQLVYTAPTRIYSIISSTAPTHSPHQPTYCTNSHTAPTRLLHQLKYCTNPATAPTCILHQLVYCTNPPTEQSTSAPTYVLHQPSQFTNSATEQSTNYCTNLPTALTYLLHQPTYC